MNQQNQQSASQLIGISEEIVKKFFDSIDEAEINNKLIAEEVLTVMSICVQKIVFTDLAILMKNCDRRVVNHEVDNIRKQITSVMIGHEVQNQNSQSKLLPST